MTWGAILIALVGVALLFVAGVLGALAVWMSGEKPSPVSYRSPWGRGPSDAVMGMFPATDRICEGGEHFCNPCACWRESASQGDPVIARKLHLDDMTARGF